MKTTFLFLAFFFFVSFSFAQTKVKKDESGNFVTLQTIKEKKHDQKTGQFLTLKNGEKFPVYVSDKGRFYVIRTSKKTGKEYKQFLAVVE